MRSRTKIVKPNPRYALSIAACSISPQRSVKLALQSPDWYKAMQLENRTMLENQTWELVDHLPSDKVLNSNWVFKVKQLLDGFADRLKARLIANGTPQIEGKDYQDTFSPVVKATSIHLVLMIAITRGWRITQIDIGYTFLNDILMVKSSCGSHWVSSITPLHTRSFCLLKKEVYGLKQSSWIWCHRLHNFLFSLGFRGNIADPLLFILLGDHTIYVLVYVDNMVVTGSDEQAGRQILDKLGQEFAVWDLTPLRYFLRIRMRRGEHTQ